MPCESNVVVLWLFTFGDVSLHDELSLLWTIPYLTLADLHTY